MPNPLPVRPRPLTRPDRIGTRSPIRLLRRRALAPLVALAMLATACRGQSDGESATGSESEVTGVDAPPERRWPGDTPAGAAGGLVPTDKVGVDEMTAFLTDTICAPEQTDNEGSRYTLLSCDHESGDVRVVAFQFDQPAAAWVRGAGLAEDYIATDIPEWCTYGMVVDEWAIFLFHLESREAAEVVSAFQFRFWDALPMVVGCLFDAVESGTTVVDFERTWAASAWCNPDFRGNVPFRKAFADTHPDTAVLPAAGFMCGRNGGDVSAAMYPTSGDAALAVERHRDESATGTCRRVGVVDRWVFEEDTGSSSGSGADFVSGLDQVRATVAIDCP
ncbi:MAG: hypothetical protein ACK5RL_09730 [Acidimicrobiales bacterium]